MNNDVLTAVPLFLFMGYMIERSNILDRLFYSLQVALRAIPGAMAVAALVTCALFATATGIVGAVVTLMGLLAFPAMLKAGYDQKLSSGVICAGGAHRRTREAQPDAGGGASQRDDGRRLAAGRPGDAADQRPARQVRADVAEGPARPACAGQARAVGQHRRLGGPLRRARRRGGARSVPREARALRPRCDHAPPRRGTRPVTG